VRLVRFDGEGDDHGKGGKDSSFVNPWLVSTKYYILGNERKAAYSSVGGNKRKVSG